MTRRKPISVEAEPAKISDQSESQFIPKVTISQTSEELLSQPLFNNPEIQPSKADMSKIIYELETHQRELEAINEELILANSSAELATKKYVELYDFAPCGYFSLNREGKIKKLNLTGATMLGSDRSLLKESSFDFFVSSDTKPIFSMFLNQVFKTNTLSSCELTLSCVGKLPIFVYLQGLMSENDPYCLLTVVDITFNKLAEQRLAASENKYRSLFAIEKDALLLVDNETFTILEANEAACFLYGYSKEELLNLKNYELSAVPEETRRMREDFKERVENRLHKKKDGTVILVDISACLFELQGRLVIFTAIRDMTMKKKFEDLNLFRIHLLQFAVNHSLDDLLEETLNRAEELTGSQIGFYHFVEPDQKTVKLQSWSTRTKREFCTAEGKGMNYDISTAGVWVDCVREGHAVIHNDYSALPHKKGFPAGHAVVIRETVVPVIRNKKIVAIMGVGNKPTDYSAKDLNFISFLADLAWDIAGLKRAEEVLHLSEARFKTMFNESPIGIALVDSLSGQICDVNPMFAKIAGRKVEEMLLIDLISIIHPDDIQRYLDNMALMNSGLISRFQMEKRYLLPNGTPVWINMTMAAIHVDDKTPPRHLCMIEDITNRKKNDQEIKIKNEELLKINIEKDKFFSIIAHDLRGPFSGFLGLTEILADRLSAMTADEIQQMAFLMRQSATNLFNLLGNLLEWSRVQRGLIQYKPTSCKLKSKTAESVAVIMNLANKKNITISNELPEEMVVFADENMLALIIRNLVSNAVKFSRNGGHVVVSAKYVSNNWIEIAVKDGGIGMSQNLLQDLFRIDIKTNRLGTEGEYSTGLGLILCKDFIEMHGGVLNVVSEENKGSVFSFTLPTKPVKQLNVN